MSSLIQMVKSSILATVEVRCSPLLTGCQSGVAFSFNSFPKFIARDHFCLVIYFGATSSAKGLLLVLHSLKDDSWWGIWYQGMNPVGHMQPNALPMLQYFQF